MSNIKIVQYNEKTECDVQDGVSPSQILYSGLIENIPIEIMGKIGILNLYNSLSTEDECVFIYTTN